MTTKPKTKTEAAVVPAKKHRPAQGKVLHPMTPEDLQAAAEATRPPKPTLPAPAPETPPAPPAKQRRGFAAMDRDKQRQIAAKGGAASHAQGKGHEWTKESAREAGRKGGLASRGGRGKATKPVEQPTE